MTDGVRVAIRTLGCKVNRVESESIAAELLGRGASVVSEDAADVVIVNTCTVTGEADAKARKAVRRALAAQRQPVVVVTGCLAALDKAGLESLGSRVIVESEKGEIARLLAERFELGTESECVSRTGERFRTRALLKIEDGCDAFCSYCIVPHARGGPVSVPMAELERELERMASSGTAEVVLTGVNLGRYSSDGNDLAALVRAAARSGIARVRLSSIEPLDLTQDLLDALASTPGVCPHFHVPMQSGSDGVLASMGRDYSIAEYERLIAAARGAVSGLAVTTDVIVGFPGESAQDAAQTVEACERIAFAKLHVFRYSARRGTPAASMPGQVPPAARRERSEVLRAAGERLRAQYLASRVGTKTEVLVEKVASGRASGTTPDYMNVTFETTERPAIGSLVPVTVTGTGADGLLGRCAQQR